MDFEAKIISKHNLDVSSIENLAKDIANRLNSNVEYGEYSVSENGHEFKLLDKITKNQGGIFSTLYDLKNNKTSNYDYVLELGEEAKLIYKDMISFIPPWEEKYQNVKSNYNLGKLITDSYYSGVFQELHNFGADKVVFIEESNQHNVSIKHDQTWENYINHIQKNGEFFTVTLEKS